MDKQVQEVYANYDIESAVLFREVRQFSKMRILLNGLKTIVFD